MKEWIEESKRVMRLIEIKDGLICEHLPMRVNEDDIIINQDGKKVCKGCCDQTEFKPFINTKGQEVCLLCCEHNITETDENGGNKYCLECFEALPQTYCYLSPNLRAMIEREKERERKRNEREQKKLERSERQTVVELKAIVKSLRIKGYSKLKKSELKALIASHKD